jgi:hypothetical protein
LAAVYTLITGKHYKKYIPPGGDETEKTRGVFLYRGAVELGVEIKWGWGAWYEVNGVWCVVITK